MSGKGADIFFGSYFDMDFENLADKGALVDLYELIDADEDIGREDFIQSILNAMEYKGKLYAVPHDFSLYTIVGKKSLLEKYDKWDYDALLKKWGRVKLSACIVRAMAKMRILHFFFIINIPHYH